MKQTPAWTNGFWVWVMVLDMFFKMLWQRFHKSQAGKDKVLIAKIRAGQKRSFDRHSTQVDLAGKHSTKSLPGKICWVWWCRLMQWVYGLAKLMTVNVHFDQVSDMAIVWIEYSQICSAPWKTCRGHICQIWKAWLCESCVFSKKMAFQNLANTIDNIQVMRLLSWMSTYFAPSQRKFAFSKSLPRSPDLGLLAA